MPALRTQLHTTIDDLLSHRREWDDLHTAARGTVFQSSDWAAAWWAFYGDLVTLRAASFRDETGRLAGLMPCFLSRGRIGPFPFTRLRLLGECEVYGEYAPLIRPGRETDVAAAAADFLAGELMGGDGPCLDFNSLPAESPFMILLLARLAAAGFAVHVDPSDRDRMTIPALPADPALYLKRLNKQARGHLRRDERLLFQNGGRYEAASRPIGQDLFAVLESLHDLGWSRKGRGAGYFHSRNRFREFLRRMVPELALRDAACLHFIMAGNEPVAATLTFVANGHYVEYVGGFDPGHRLSKYGPGKVLSSLCIRDAIARGCTDFDLQGGRERYKSELGCRLTGYGRAIVHRRGPRSLLPLLFTAAVRARKTLQRRKVRG